MTQSLPDALVRLTPRQRECLRLVYERRTSKEISLMLGLGSGTVDTYITEATTLLGARNRRHAAELLHEVERAWATPGKFELEKSGVATDASLLPEIAREAAWTDFSALLPTRFKGALGNDLNPLFRFGWIVQLAITLAVGFGMLVVGLDVLAHFLQGPR